MIPLYNYISNNNISNNNITIDGHVHLFSHRGSLKNPYRYECNSCIGFIDIELDSLNEYKDIPGLYKKFIKEHPEFFENPNNKLLASGLNIDDIKNIYNQNPDKISGFGELKLYDTSHGEKINLKKISFAKDVCKFSESVGNLPVYIHFGIKNKSDVERFNNILGAYPYTPIVLCHAGMTEGYEERAWSHVREFMKNYNNLYIDISWDGLAYFGKNPIQLTQGDINRMFWGSDISPKQQKLLKDNKVTYKGSDIINWKNSINNFIRSDINIKKLFNV